MADSWRYPHQDFGERPNPDGSPTLRPCVLITALHGAAPDYYAGLVDSGSPITVADADFLHDVAGVDLDAPADQRRMNLGGYSGLVRLYDISLRLLPQVQNDGPDVTWKLTVAALPRWPMRFPILLGMNGWFNRFPTTIDASSTTVTVRPVPRDVLLPR